MIQSVREGVSSRDALSLEWYEESDKEFACSLLWKKMTESERFRPEA